MSFGNLLTTDFDTGDGGEASYHSRVCDGDDHWNYWTEDAARPVLSSNSRVDSRTYC